MLRSNLKTKRHALSALWVAAAICCVVDTAQARKPGPGEDACLADGVCVGLYEEARRLSKSGDYATALAAYQGAYHRRPVPWLLINIGRTLHKLGRYGEALSHYRRYLADEPKGPSDRLQTVHDYIAQAEKAQAEPSPAESAKPEEASAAARSEATSPSTTAPNTPTEKPPAEPAAASKGAPAPGTAQAAVRDKANEPVPSAPTDQAAAHAAGTAVGHPSASAAPTPEAVPAAGPLQPSSQSPPANQGAAPVLAPPSVREPQPDQAARSADSAGGLGATRRPVPAYFWAGIATGGALIVGGTATGIAALLEARSLQDTPYAGVAPSSLIDQQARVRSLALASDVLLALGGGTVGIVSVVLLIQRYGRATAKR
ncbi:MAG: hypothetical protein JNJ46_07900 [Myxococcales bacterium]|nr:hypothetical protein [Myxococcales bacterium]